VKSLFFSYLARDDEAQYDTFLAAGTRLDEPPMLGKDLKPA
jgi:hypothetical protein